MISSLALALAGGLAVVPVTPVAPVRPMPLSAWLTASHSDRFRINVWTDRDDPYPRGGQARVYFRSDADAYVTVVRLDTDGRLRVLFPTEPWEDNFVRGGRTFEVLGRSQSQAFTVDDYPGVGYVFAIASPEPFNYDPITRGDHWDYRTIADGRVRGDPYVGLTDFAAQISTAQDYDYDLAEYYVERHYDYPRFVCYDCHTYTSYAYWNPYDSFCSRFRIVVYDDPYYYPYRYYRGRNVVITRPFRPEPRYVFKDYDGRGDYLTRVTERPRTPDGRRPSEGYRTSADVGGRGAVPAPVAPRARPDASSTQPAAPQADPSRSVPDRRRVAEPATPSPSTQAPTDRSQPDPGRAERPDDAPRRVAPSNRRPEAEPVPPQRPEPQQTEPQRSEPQRAEPQRAEPRRPEPQRSEPPRTERTRPEPPRSEPVRREPPQREAPPPATTPPPAAAPPPRERPQSEPQARPAPAQPSPKGTGEPELRRRRPNHN